MACCARCRYTGKIFLAAPTGERFESGHAHDGLSGNWYEAGPHTVTNYSAVCWLTARYLFEHVNGGGGRPDDVPFGLILSAVRACAPRRLSSARRLCASPACRRIAHVTACRLQVGAHPIESWMSAAALAEANISGPCTFDGKADPSSKIWEGSVSPIAPYVDMINPLACAGRNAASCCVECRYRYTVAAMIWDQGERDIKCERTSAYPAMQRALVRQWREAFSGRGLRAGDPPPWPFVAVQLPGYDLDKRIAHPPPSHSPWEMRLAQEAACDGDDACAVVATYDDSCEADEQHGCPHGHVHNVHKQPVGHRLALQLRRLLYSDPIVAEGPRADSAYYEADSDIRASYKVTATFRGGGTPFYFRDARNCTACCANASASDFDVSAEGAPDGTWVMGSRAAVAPSGTDAVFTVAGLGGAPVALRYTAARLYPQCVLYNAEGLPAPPFTLPVTAARVQTSSPTSSLTSLVNLAVGTGGNDFGAGSMPMAAQYASHDRTSALCRIASSPWGSRSRYPRGAMRVGPDTEPAVALEWLPFQHYGGYHYHDGYIRSFTHTHTVGAGVSDLGNLGVMAVSKPPSARLFTERGATRSAFRHEDESTAPGRYAVAQHGIA